MARLLQYLECPQYLRKHIFPVHPDLRAVGLLAPLDAPHHLRIDEPCASGVDRITPRTAWHRLRLLWREGGRLVLCWRYVGPKQKCGNLKKFRKTPNGEGSAGHVPGHEQCQIPEIGSGNIILEAAGVRAAGWSWACAGDGYGSWLGFRLPYFQIAVFIQITAI